MPCLLKMRWNPLTGLSFSNLKPATSGVALKWVWSPPARMLATVVARNIGASSPNMVRKATPVQWGMKSLMIWYFSRLPRMLATISVM